MDFRFSTAVTVAVASLMTLVAPTAGAQAAAGKATTQVHVSVVPATAKVGTTVTVVGSVTPKGGTVTLQRLVAKKWVGLAHVKASRTGSFALRFHAPRSATTLALRVVRAASGSAKAGVSRTLHVHVVKTAYAVSAAAPAVTLPTALTITGKVAPKAGGSVLVQRLSGKTWVTLGKAPLSKSSTFAFHKVLAAGSYKLRVTKPFSTKVAAGVSKSFTVAVHPQPVPVNPSVTTTALPGLTVGRAVSATLAATGGHAPYTWAVVAGALPTGLSLLPSGTLTGTPTTIGSTSFTARVTDAAGHSGTGVVSATVGAVAVRSWGYNLNGETGNGTTTSSLTLTTAALPWTVKSVSVGLDYGLALLTDGTVYAWGVNGSGQLGQGNTIDRPTPVVVPGLTNVVSIAAGLETSYAVTAGGQLYAWGANESGELGDGTLTGRMSPAVVTSVANVVAVSAANQYVLVLFASGRVDSFGNGVQGTLGNGTETSQQKTPVGIDSLGGVRAVVAGQVAAYAILNDNTVMSWGRFEHGQLGNTTPARDTLWQPLPEVVTGVTGVTSLGCGFEYCVASHTDGTVSAWGYGVDGEQGNGSNTDNLTAATVPGLTGVVQVAAAHQTAYALRSDGRLYSWGVNNSNQLGNGDATHTNTAVPALVPGLSSIFRIAAGSQTAFALQSS